MAEVGGGISVRASVNGIDIATASHRCGPWGRCFFTTQRVPLMGLGQSGAWTSRINTQPERRVRYSFEVVGHALAELESGVVQVHSNSLTPTTDLTECRKSIDSIQKELA